MKYTITCLLCFGLSLIGFAQELDLDAPLPEDPERALWKILNPDRFDPIMAESLRFPRVLDAAESLIRRGVDGLILATAREDDDFPEQLVR